MVSQCLPHGKRRVDEQFHSSGTNFRALGSGFGWMWTSPGRRQGSGDRALPGQFRAVTLYGVTRWREAGNRFGSAGDHTARPQFQAEAPMGNHRWKTKPKELDFNNEKCISDKNRICTWKIKSFHVYCLIFLVCTPPSQRWSKEKWGQHLAQQLRCQLTNQHPIQEYLHSTSSSSYWFQIPANRAPWWQQRRLK